MGLLQRYKKLPAAAKAAIWFLICGILQRGVSVITMPIFTRILTTDEYGLYTLYNSWLEILGVFLTLRLSYGVFMQHLVKYDSDRDKYTSSMQSLTTLLVLVWMAIYLPLQDFWNGLIGLNTFLMMCLFFSEWSSAMFGFWSARQRVEYKYRALVAVTLAVALITPTAGILAVLSTQVYKVEARITVIVVVQLIFYGTMFVYYMVKGRTIFNKTYWLQALRFNLPLVPHYLSQNVLHQADRIMINSMVSSSAAGIYGVAGSISSVMQIVNQSILNALNPWIYQHIRDKEYSAIAGISYVALIAVAAVNLLLIAFAPEIMFVFAPEAYQEAIWVIPPLAASVVVTFTYSLFADFEFYFEHTRYVLIASVTGAVVNIILNIIFIPMFGFIAAGYTTLVSYLIYVVMHYIFMRVVQKKEMEGTKVYDIRILLLIFACFAVLAVITVLLYSVVWARIAIAAAIIIIAIVRRKSLMDMWHSLRASRGK